MEVPADSAETPGEAAEPAETEAAEPDPGPPPEPAPAPAEEPPLLGEVWTITLDNGLRVVGRRDSRQRSTALCVHYRVGHVDDPEDHTGLAHLTEHLMFRPFGQMPRGFHGLLEPAGATYINAFTMDDETRYCSSFPDEALPRALFGEGERMGFLLDGLSAESVAVQRRVVRNEADERAMVRTGPLARLRRLDLEQVYPEDHPIWRRYRTEADVADLTLSNVQWFHQTYYSPSNAVVSIVSPRRREDIEPLIRRFFGHLAGPRVTPRPTATRPPLRESVRVTYTSLLKRPTLIVSWPTPSFRAPGDAEMDYIAIHLEEALDDALPDETPVSVRQYSDFEGSWFRIHVHGDEGDDLEPLLPIIDRALDRIRREGLSEAAFEEVRARAMVSFVQYSRMGRAGRLGRSLLFQSAPHSEEDERERYLAVTRESIRTAARRHLPNAPRIVILTEHSSALGMDLDGHVSVRRGR